MKVALFALVVLAVIPSSQAFLIDSFGGLLSFIFNLLGFGSLVTRACDDISNAFGLQKLGCKCTGRFGDGIEAELKCKTPEDAFCLIGSSFCGLASTEIYVIKGGLFSFPDIKKTSSCVDAKFNLPPPLDVFDWDNAINVPEICISTTGAGNDLDIASCSATVNGDSCTSCTVCANKKDVTFDCSNRSINPLGAAGTFIAGPKVTTCIGLGFLLGGP